MRLQVANHVIGQHRYRQTSGDGMPIVTDDQSQCALNPLSPQRNHNTLIAFW